MREPVPYISQRARVLHRRASEMSERADERWRAYEAMVLKQCARFGLDPDTVRPDPLLVDLLARIRLVDGRWIWTGARNSAALPVVSVTVAPRRRTQRTVARYLGEALGAIPRGAGGGFVNPSDPKDLNPWRRVLVSGGPGRGRRRNV